ncbi:putative GTP-binding protein EngB [Smittium culicis]|uniref:Putative GTP-binding protein EngB n=1 Tax=Smittium culicis TaxID=133412 RepID=A0A1R1Y043_9FUNG|nr:putative GTP-binding protein EngB [Smittium culicis]
MFNSIHINSKSLSSKKIFGTLFRLSYSRNISIYSQSKNYSSNSNKIQHDKIKDELISIKDINCKDIVDPIDRSHKKTFVKRKTILEKSLEEKRDTIEYYNSLKTSKEKKEFRDVTKFFSGDFESALDMSENAISTKTIVFGKESGYSSEFITAMHKFDFIKGIKGPDVAFAGRSNVGKSSLINAILNSKDLVKTSGKPGHTKSINFFRVGSINKNKNLYVVDMPGYGFKSRTGWGKVIIEYFKNRKE